MATQHKEVSFNAFLSSTPTIKELTEHVNVSTNWYLVGTMLDLDQKRLKSIEAHTGHTDAHKMVEMYNLWLETKPTASRREVLEALRVDAVEEVTLAHRYEMYLRELHETIYAPPSTEAVSILQRNIQSLSKALVSPVQVSQLLYCKRCISEATLDEMERIDQRRSLDDKKTTLLTAMQETVSSDYRKLKDIATVLSNVEETRDIANEIMTKYEEKIPHEEDGTVVQPQEVVGSNEDRASDILMNNYSALSQSITEPVRMARLLNEEVVSDEALSCVMSTRGSVSDSRAVLLKAVRDAVHSNYQHLELFVTVLRKFSETAHIGDTIFEEYKHNFNTDLDDVEEMETNRGVELPWGMREEFQEMRTKFGTTFYNFRDVFSKKAKSKKFVDKIKTLLADIFPDLESELSPQKTIKGVLDVVKRRCSIVNVHPLEVLAVHFKVKEAEDIIKEHKEAAKEFCKSVSVSLSENETLQAVSTQYLLSETITFVLNWNPDKTTLQDVNDVLLELELLHKYPISVVGVNRRRSVVVTCYCPAEYTGSLIMAVLGKIDTLQREGLKEFILGNCTVWNTTQVVSENTEETDLLAQINDLEAALKNRDERIEATETELARFKELSGKRLEEIEALKMDLEKSQSINVQYEKMINKLKKEIASLEEKLSEKEDMLTQYLKEIEENRNVVLNQNSVQLTLLSADQCMEVISKLEDQHKVMVFNECQSIQSLIPKVLERKTTGLIIQSSFFTRDDILSFSSQLSTNESLEALALCDDSINDNGVTVLAQSLHDNKTLEYLFLNRNSNITSDSAQPLAELLLNNKTLKYLHLHDTNIDTDGVLKLMESLNKNKTLIGLRLDAEHEEICATLPYYEQISKILTFCK